MEAESTAETLEAPETTVQTAEVSSPSSVSDKSFKAGLREAVNEDQTQADTVVTETPETEPVDNQQAETLLAGKFRTPQDLERSYKELERRLGEDGRYKPEVERLKGELARLAGVNGARDPDGQQQNEPEWVQNWRQHPLGNIPNPLMNKEDHQEWIEKVFTPHFINDPAGTIGFFVTPVAEQLREEFRSEWERRDRMSQIEQAIDGFYTSPADWSGGVPVNEALKNLPPEAVELHNELLSKNYPPEAAAEIVYHRFTTGQVREQNAALTAKEQDLKQLARGQSSRGLSPTSPEALPAGDPEDFAANMAAALSANGHDLGNYKPRRKLR